MNLYMWVCFLCVCLKMSKYIQYIYEHVYVDMFFIYIYIVCVRKFLKETKLAISILKNLI